jgi:hypothetical protein
MRSELFKVLRDGRSCHGGSLTWPLPSQNEDGSWTPGEWVEVSGPLSMCSNGLHLTTNPREWYVEAAQVYAAEYDGEIVRDDGSDKVCVRRARLLSEVAWSDHGVYHEGHHDLYGNAQATLYGNAQARLYGNAQATLYGNAQATLYGNAQATSDRWHSPSATVALAQLAAHIDRRGGKLILRSAETEGTDGRTH